MPYSSMSQACRSLQQSLYDWQLLPVLAVDCSGQTACSACARPGSPALGSSPLHYVQAR